MHNLCACLIDFLILPKIRLKLCGLLYEPSDVQYLINIGPTMLGLLQRSTYFSVIVKTLRKHIHNYIN